MKTLAHLKKNGYRITKPRQEIIKVLKSYPLTVSDIHHLLTRKNIRIDLASVYRTLELFVELGIVRRIEIGGDKNRYELSDEENHHHHLVCNNCGTIEDITVNENSLLEEVNNKSAFKIDHHHLEFFGLCRDCQ